MSRKTVFLIFALALLAACHTRPPRVDCDGRLQPINAPAPVTHSSPTQQPEKWS